MNEKYYSKLKKLIIKLATQILICLLIILCIDIVIGIIQQDLLLDQFSDDNKYVMYSDILINISMYSKLILGVIFSLKIVGDVLKYLLSLSVVEEELKK